MTRGLGPFAVFHLMFPRRPALKIAALFGLAWWSPIMLTSLPLAFMFFAWVRRLRLRRLQAEGPDLPQLYAKLEQAASEDEAEGADLR